MMTQREAKSGRYSRRRIYNCKCSIWLIKIIHFIFQTLEENKTSVDDGCNKLKMKIYVRLVTWNLCAKPPPPTDQFLSLIPRDKYVNGNSTMTDHFNEQFIVFRIGFMLSLLGQKNVRDRLLYRQ